MTADVLSRAFAALADPTRRDMVARLAEGDATVSQLAEPYRMTLQAVYKHLRVLEDAGLVSRPRAWPPRPGSPSSRSPSRAGSASLVSRTSRAFSAT